MVWRWLLSLLLGILAMLAVFIVLYVFQVWRFGLMVPAILAAVAGMWVAARTAPVLKLLSAVLVPVVLSAAWFSFLWWLFSGWDGP